MTAVDLDRHKMSRIPVSTADYSVNLSTSTVESRTSYVVPIVSHMSSENLCCADHVSYVDGQPLCSAASRSVSRGMPPLGSAVVLAKHTVDYLAFSSRLALQPNNSDIIQ